MTAKAKKELRGRVLSADGSEMEVHAVIFPPKKEPGKQTWTCSVHSPFLFQKDKCLVGIDADQAAELADKFIDELFEHHGVIVIEHP